MRKQGVSAFKIGAVYIGTVVGAGFATGQEILQFFLAFGFHGFWGIALTSLLFMIFGYIIMKIGYNTYAQSHLDILKTVGGRLTSRTLDIIITFFLFGSLTAMIAGCGALFSEQFGLPYISGCIIMAIITAITVLSGINGVINSISIVVPFLLFSVIGISVYAILNPASETVTVAPNVLVGNWAMSSVIYTSYNILISVAVLGPLGANARDERDIRNGAIFGALGLGMGMVMIFLALSNSGNFADTQVPMIHIAGSISKVIQLIYAVILTAEVYTTAVGSLYGFSVRIRSRFRTKTIIVITTFFALICGLLGFSNLVRYLYPIVGYGGIILLLKLLFRKRGK